MRREVRIAGFGGQGVITMGTILAMAAGLHEHLEVAQTQSYGPEARGGACRCDVIISEEPIDYTKPLDLDLFIALSPPALQQYWPEVRPGKTIVMVDKTLITEVPPHSPPVWGIEATRIAEEEFKSRLVANMIILGSMASITGWVSLAALEETIKKRMGGKMIELSTKALRRGFEISQKLRKKELGHLNSLFD